MPTKKKKSDKDVDINIKVNNLEKAIKAGMGKQKKKKWCGGGSCGCGGCWVFGSALAIVLSYTQNSSILWAIIHGILSWFYVIYRIIIQLGWF